MIYGALMQLFGFLDDNDESTEGEGMFTFFIS